MCKNVLNSLYKGQTLYHDFNNSKQINFINDSIYTNNELKMFITPFFLC